VGLAVLSDFVAGRCAGCAHCGLLRTGLSCGRSPFSLSQWYLVWHLSLHRSELACAELGRFQDQWEGSV